MARYQIQLAGVFDTLTAALVLPSNYVAWTEYQAWLTAGNVPDPLPVDDPYPTVALQRTEALARLEALRMHITEHGTITAAGHTWKSTPIFWLAVLTFRVTYPPIPPGFALPDALGVQVTLNNADLSAIGAALADRALTVFNVAATLRTAINASATPLTVPLVGWPP